MRYNGFCRYLNELLWITLEIIEAAAVDQNAHKTAARKLRLVLEIGQKVRQFNVCFLKDDRRGSGGFFRRYATSPDGKVGLPDLNAGLGNRRTFPDCLRTLTYQLLVIKLHPVCGLVFNTIPERLKLFAVQHCLTGLDWFPIIGVLDVQPSGQLP